MDSGRLFLPFRAAMGAQPRVLACSGRPQNERLSFAKTNWTLAVTVARTIRATRTLCARSTCSGRP